MKRVVPFVGRKYLLGMYFMAILVAAFDCPAVFAQTPETQPQDADPRSTKLFLHFDTTAKSLSVTSQGDDVPFSWIETPLFRFSSEGQVFGSVYLWKDKAERLAILGTIGSIPINNRDVEFIELHLLSPKPIDAVTLPGNQRKEWSPETESLQLRPVPNAPKVAASDRARLVQMRSMARQFNASMTEGEQTHRLRLLPQPLFRYEESSQQHDGGLFAFIWDKGTDPELVLRFEVARNDNDELTWMYQPVRFTWRELKLNHQSDQVYHVPEFVDRDLPMQNTPYVTGLTSPIP